MCHFHQKRIIQRYITKHPKLEASQELKKIVSSLTKVANSDCKANFPRKTTDLTFTIKLDKWYDKYKDFLNEKTLNESTQKRLLLMLD